MAPLQPSLLLLTALVWGCPCFFCEAGPVGLLCAKVRRWSRTGQHVRYQVTAIQEISRREIRSRKAPRHPKGHISARFHGYAPLLYTFSPHLPFPLFFTCQPIPLHFLVLCGIEFIDSALTVSSYSTFLPLVTQFVSQSNRYLHKRQNKANIQDYIFCELWDSDPGFPQGQEFFLLIFCILYIWINSLQVSVNVS